MAKAQNPYLTNTIHYIKNHPLPRILDEDRTKHPDIWPEDRKIPYEGWYLFKDKFNGGDKKDKTAYFEGFFVSIKDMSSDDKIVKREDWQKILNEVAEEMNYAGYMCTVTLNHPVTEDKSLTGITVRLNNALTPYGAPEYLEAFQQLAGCIKEAKQKEFDRIKTNVIEAIRSQMLPRGESAFVNWRDEYKVHSLVRGAHESPEHEKIVDLLEQCGFEVIWIKGILGLAVSHEQGLKISMKELHRNPDPIADKELWELSDAVRLVKLASNKSKVEIALAEEIIRKYKADFLQKDNLGEILVSIATQCQNKEFLDMLENVRQKTPTPGAEAADEQAELKRKWTKLPEFTGSGGNTSKEPGHEEKVTRFTGRFLDQSDARQQQRS